MLLSNISLNINKQQTHKAPLYQTLHQHLTMIVCLQREIFHHTITITITINNSENTWDHIWGFLLLQDGNQTTDNNEETLKKNM